MPQGVGRRFQPLASNTCLLMMFHVEHAVNCVAASAHTALPQSGGCSTQQCWHSTVGQFYSGCCYSLCGLRVCCHVCAGRMSCCIMAVKKPCDSTHRLQPCNKHSESQYRNKQHACAQNWTVDVRNVCKRDLNVAVPVGSAPCLHGCTVDTFVKCLQCLAPEVQRTKRCACLANMSWMPAVVAMSRACVSKDVHFVRDVR
jgi:hypothetical protein